MYLRGSDWTEVVPYVVAQGKLILYPVFIIATCPDRFLALTEDSCDRLNFVGGTVIYECFFDVM
jgi:hypothetical protein